MMTRNGEAPKVTVVTGGGRGRAVRLLPAKRRLKLACSGTRAGHTPTSGARVLCRPIEIIAADMLNKPDVAAAIASRWFDVEGVDAITDVPVTSVALAVQNVAFERKKIILITSPHDVSAFLLVPGCPSGVRRGLPRMQKQ